MDNAPGAAGATGGRVISLSNKRKPVGGAQPQQSPRGKKFRRNQAPESKINQAVRNQAQYKINQVKKQAPFNQVVKKQAAPNQVVKIQAPESKINPVAPEIKVSELKAEPQVVDNQELVENEEVVENLASEFTCVDRNLEHQVPEFNLDNDNKLDFQVQVTKEVVDRKLENQTELPTTDVDTKLEVVDQVQEQDQVRKTLESSDGTIFEVEEFQFPMEDVTYAESKILQKVIDFCTVKNKSTMDDDTAMNVWITEFQKINDLDTVVQIVSAARDLGVERLTELAINKGCEILMTMTDEAMLGFASLL